MRKCTLCLEEKNDSNFYVDKRLKDGLSRDCRDCRRAGAKDIYYSDVQKARTRSIQAGANRRARRTLYIKDIRSKYSCRLCSMKDDEVLDFHHYDPKGKSFKITSFKSVNFTDLVLEINKCVVLCANCHRKVHAGTAKLSSDLCCKEKVPAKLHGKQIHSQRYVLP